MDTLFSFQYMRVLVALLLATMIAAVAVYAAQSLNWLIDDNYATINVEGVAEVMAVPDVGTFSFSVEVEAADVASAQTEATETMNDIMAYLRDTANVAEKDVQTTGYNAYPRYEFQTTGDCTFGECPRERVIVGYVVSQNVTVTVRETEDAGTLIGGVGQRGATNMSGLNFEVDDIESIKEEVRLAAIADAKAKAERIADELDVRLGDVLSFSDGDGYYPMPYESKNVMAMDMEESGRGGGAAPDIAVGEDTITARVTVTYEIK